MNRRIPKIAVTYVDGESERTKVITEHTDEEDLNSEDETRRRRLPTADPLGVTDNELFEATDGEESPDERPKTPTPYTFPDYGGIVEEVSEVRDDKKGVIRGKSMLTEKGVFLGLERDVAGTTDLEDFEASDEEYEEDPEDFDLEDIGDDRTVITDRFKGARASGSRSPMPSPSEGSGSERSAGKSLIAADVTDAEEISDVENTLSVCRMGKKKRRKSKRYERTCHSPISQLLDAMIASGMEVNYMSATTDVEELSGNESAKCKMLRGGRERKKKREGSTLKMVVDGRHGCKKKAKPKLEKLSVKSDAADVSTEAEDLSGGEVVKVEEKKTAEATDTEEVSDFDEPQCAEEKELKLPKAPRRLILISESASGRNTSIILPLDDFVFRGLKTEVDDGKTDVEEVEAPDPEISTPCRTPELQQHDYGNIEDREVEKMEKKKKSKRFEELFEPVTDSEEILLSEKRSKRRALKAVTHITGRHLAVADAAVGHTDVEELLSDVEEKKPATPDPDGATDLEHVDVSSAEETSDESYPPELPLTTVEETTPTANIQRKIFYSENFLKKPDVDRETHTDVDDVLASTGDSTDTSDEDILSTLNEASKTFVYITNDRKANWDDPSEDAHKKEFRQQSDLHTDVEDISGDEVAKRKPERNRGLARCRKRREGTEKGQTEKFVRETQGIRSAITEDSDLKSSKENVADDAKRENENSEIVDGTQIGQANLETSEDFPDERTTYSYVTLPSFKRKYHSQRLASREGPTITPYQGEYDETYSSDEDGEYIVQEPDDVIREELPASFQSSPDIFDPEFIFRKRARAFSQATVPRTHSPSDQSTQARESETGEVHSSNGDSVPSVAQVEETIVPKEDKPVSAEYSAVQHVTRSTEVETLKSPVTKSAVDEEKPKAQSPVKEEQISDGIPKLKKENSAEEAEESSLIESPSSKPRVIFYLESEEEAASDSDAQNTLDSTFIDRAREELKTALQKDQLILDDRLLGMRSGVFDDLSDESLTRTKELVDERLRKISETKSIDEAMLKKEKSPARAEIKEQFKIGRFHVTTSLDATMDVDAERKIAEKLMTDRQTDEIREEMERELPEKLSDEGFAAVLKEISKTTMQLPLDDIKKEEKKERTLKRVERRFERMASETLEKEMEEENVSEEKLIEKREVEFQKMLSQLSTEEVAECQQEYLQLWDDGGLSSFTPTDDWESRDMDTPENELDEDSPKKPESSRGLRGSGKYEEPGKSPSEARKSSKFPETSAEFQTSPPEPVRISDDISPVTHSLGITHPLHVGSSPSEMREDENLSYDDRKKFWEGMTTSQSSEIESEKRRSFHEGVAVKRKMETESETRTEKVRTPEDGGLVKSLTGMYSEKIAAGEIVMPAMPRPKSGNLRDLIANDDAKQEETIVATYLKKDTSPDAAGVSELEAELMKRRSFVEESVVSETTAQKEVVTGTVVTRQLTQESSVDSEKEFLSKYGEESVAFDNSAFREDDEFDLSEEKKDLEEKFHKRPPPVPLRKTIYDRSMSLPAEDIEEGTSALKTKKRSFEAQVKKEIIVEQLMTQAEEECSAEHKSLKEYSVKQSGGVDENITKTVTEVVKKATGTSKTLEIKDAAADVVDDLLKKGARYIDQRTVVTQIGKLIPKVDVAPGDGKVKETCKAEEETVPSITVTLSGKKQADAASLGESEDTQSESDVTPEDARVVDNGEAPWDGSGTQSGGISPKDDFDVVRDSREPGIGRWIGQEDLSQQIWEKEDIDTSCFKMETKWERTRSESPSPKDPFVCTPEEHYPDTVWEVPVQEHLESEEITEDIPIEKQVIIEKDEEEEEEEEEEVEKPFKGNKITEVEAREIAEEVLEYIEFEVENRASILMTDIDDIQEEPQNQVTEYLRQLAGEKNLDDDEIQLIQSVLAQKHRDQVKKLQDRQVIGSSQEITDEDLRSNEPETDSSPVESQTDKFPIKDEPKDDGVEKKKLRDVEIVDRTIAEVKESLEAAQEELIEQRKKRQKEEILKKESPSEFEFKGINIDKKYEHGFESSEWRTSKDYETIDEEGDRFMEKVETSKRSDLYTEGADYERTEESQKITGTDLSETKFDETAKKEEECKGLTETERITQQSDKITKDMTSSVDVAHRTLTEKEKIAKEMLERSDDLERTEKYSTEKSTDELEEAEILQKESAMESKDEKFRDVKKHKRERSVMEEREESSSESETRSGGMTQKIFTTHTAMKVCESVTTAFKSLSSEEKLKELEIPPEGVIFKKVDIHKYSSEDSPRSTSQDEAIRSGGEEALSSSPSLERQNGGSKDIKMRRTTGGLLPKGDRRSGTDLEPYSSSGESHYQSCELMTSRPCSSDVEALIVGVGGTGSSEYESALSQELSSRQTTSGEYHTAVSSLSSRESIKSLDSESSGHLASIEISSDASETLIPSAMELDKDLEMSGAILLDDDSPELIEEKKSGRPPVYLTQMSAPAATLRKSVDEDFEIISESELVSWTGEGSEDDGTDAATIATEDMVVDGEDRPQKMKRSHEMTFQPEPRPIAVSSSVDTPSEPVVDKFGSSVDESIVSNQDERFGSSLEETGSILSMSLSTASETSAIRTVIEQHQTDSEKMDASMTLSAASVESGSREELDKLPLTQEMSTSTVVSSLGRKTASVTITTSTADERGIPSVSTQVTSVSRKSSMVDDAKSDSESSGSKGAKRSDSLSQANGPTQVDYVPEYDEIETTKTKKTQRHRRKESTSSFVPTMRWTVTDGKTLKRDSKEEDSSEESEKYAGMLTEKEVKNDEKKEADDSEKLEETYEYELMGESRSGIVEEEGVEEDFRELDGSRPHSQISKTDSEGGRRPVSSILSEDRPDSELSELMKQGSSETEREDPIERPMTPEPEEYENKDDTPELSSEAQASVTELEMEYSGAYSRRDEYASHVSPIREEKSGMQYPDRDMDKYEQEKVPESEFVFSDIPRHVSGDGVVEGIVAEKHESETREKELTKKVDSSPGDIPDITVTEHMTPLSDRGFHYPDMENEERERKATQSTTPDTSASSRASSSTSTDQGREYILEDVCSDRVIKEDSDMEDRQTEISMSVTDRTVLERSVIQEEDEEASDSPNSDSFEMLDKPDITDEYVIIEEVGREARETDQEGRGLRIESQKRKVHKKTSEEKEELIPSPPAPATKMTDLKYFPGDDDTGPFQFDSDSPPVAGAKPMDRLKKKSSREEESDPDVDPQLEEHKKWMEMQFQVEQAAKIIGYPYEMEFERAPLEDIKEEEFGEFDSSSKIGSMGSQKESIGSFGSVKDSFSSTPDYDVLAGRKYFTRSGEHDDVSMSSLQEFELIEKKILLENGKKSGSSSSQDSLSSKKLGTSSKSGQGDDVSMGSLKEFENLEKACVTVVKMERKAKEEEAILSEIDEGHESQISESESCETVSGVVREKPESETEDFDKKMFEIDEIIRQAQTNVERFSDLRALDKTESVGRGDSLEEVARVPDLELDAPLYGKSLYEQPKPSLIGYSTQVVTKKKVQQWRESEEQLRHGQVEGSLKHKLTEEISEGSELLEPKSKIKSVSSDSLETRTSERFDTISMDSFDMQLDKLKTKTDSIGDGSDFGDKKISDFLDEEEGRFQDKGRESSSSGRDGDYSSSGREDSEQHKPPPRSDLMLGSTDSLDPSSSTATHATYHYETDSVMSSSFTSGGSNTLVSSMDNLDLVAGAGVDDFAGKTGVWFENMSVPGTEAFVSEIIEPLDDGTFSHIIHRRSDMVPDARKVVFRGPDAEKSLQGYLESLPPEDEIEETEEVDEHGNVHIRKVVKRRVILRPGEEIPPTKVSVETLRTGLTDPKVTETADPVFEEGFSHTIHRRIEMPPDVKKVVFSGPDANRAMEEYMQRFDPGEQVMETEEVDEHGNVHVKRVVQRRLVMSSEEARGMSGSEIADYFKHFEGETWGSGQEHYFEGGGPSADGSRHPNFPLSHPITQAHIQDLRLTGKEDDEEDVLTKGTARGESEREIPAAQKESGMPRRPPLSSDISMDDEAEYDTTEHDWRYQLEILNAEADEGEIDQQLDKALETSYTSQKKH